jgi:hypothetical protein
MAKEAKELVWLQHEKIESRPNRDYRYEIGYPIFEDDSIVPV